MTKSDISGAQLFQFTVPALLLLLTVALATTTLWPLAIATALASLAAGLWGRQILKNEQADEALAAARADELP
ncbi:MAG: hypothetical protein PIR02_15835 [Microbacterium enclense]